MGEGLGSVFLGDLSSCIYMQQDVDASYLVMHGMQGLSTFARTHGPNPNANVSVDITSESLLKSEV